MYDKQPVHLDPALEALITLQQRAAPTTPTGQPTVASQVMNAVGGNIAGRVQTPQNQGIAGIIQNAQQSAPSAAQNMQQGQLDQMAQQVAQRMQQQQQPRGVTGLPVGNMGFKEGGIVPSIGYATGGTAIRPRITLPEVAFSADMGPQDSVGLGGISGLSSMPTPEPETQEMRNIRAAEERRKALEAARPDFYAQSLSAMDAIKRANEEAIAAKRKNEGFDRLMAMFSGGARAGALGMGEGVTAFDKTVEARDAAARQASALDAQERIKLGELEYARRNGLLDKEILAEKELAGIRNLRDKVKADLYGHDIQREGIISRERSSAAENASREKIAREHNAVLLKGYEVRDSISDVKQRIALFKDALDKEDIKGQVKAINARAYPNLAKKEEALADVRNRVKNMAQAFGVPQSEAYASLGLPESSTPATGGSSARTPAPSSAWGKMSKE